MNVNPGGKQQVMRNGYWDDKVLKINFVTGIPKSVRVVLQQRKVLHYMSTYLERLSGSSEYEKLVKMYKREIKSHTIKDFRTVMMHIIL